MSDDLVKRLRRFDWVLDELEIVDRAADRIEELQARAEAAEAKLAKARNEALEEAAKVAEDARTRNTVYEKSRRDAAKAIRAMMEDRTTHDLLDLPDPHLSRAGRGRREHRPVSEHEAVRRCNASHLRADPSGVP